MKGATLLAVCVITCPLFGQEPEAQSPQAAEEETPEVSPVDVAEKVKSSTFSALKARLLGPALMSGRIGDFAVNPDNHSEYFVAVCSGGVWKTTNNGTTYTPIFDSQGSYSIGCVEIDPSNHHLIWFVTGENNSQRSVSFGDGVYKSVDGGKNFKNMGLKRSAHI